MKKAKKWYIFVVVFLFEGVFVNAQDLIVMRNGDMIEAKVVEISPVEIRYKRFDHLDGPTVILPKTDVLSIRYENGRVEAINAVSPAVQENAKTDKPYAINPNKLAFGFYFDPLGILFDGGKLTLDFTKGKFNTQINLIAPSLEGLNVSFGGGQTLGGFGLVFNYFDPSRVGGFYMGGMAEYSIGFTSWYSSFSDYEYQNASDRWQADGVGLTPYSSAWNNWQNQKPNKNDYYYNDRDITMDLTAGLNIGYKFIMPSGVYFCTGAIVGASFEFFHADFNFVLRPEVTFGYTFKRSDNKAPAPRNNIAPAESAVPAHTSIAEESTPIVQVAEKYTVINVTGTVYKLRFSGGRGGKNEWILIKVGEILTKETSVTVHPESSLVLIDESTGTTITIPGEQRGRLEKIILSL